MIYKTRASLAPYFPRFLISLIVLGYIFHVQPVIWWHFSLPLIGKVNEVINYMNPVNHWFEKVNANAKKGIHLGQTKSEDKNELSYKAAQNNQQNNQQYWIKVSSQQIPSLQNGQSQRAWVQVSQINTAGEFSIDPQKNAGAVGKRFLLDDEEPVQVQERPSETTGGSQPISMQVMLMGVNNLDQLILKTWWLSVLVSVGLWGMLIKWLLPPLIKWLTYRVSISEAGLVAKTGLIFVESVQINLKNIETLQLMQTPWGRALRYGTIYVAGSGGSHIVLRHIKKPKALMKVLEATIRKNR